MFFNLEYSQFSIIKICNLLTLLHSSGLFAKIKELIFWSSWPDIWNLPNATVTGGGWSILALQPCLPLPLTPKFRTHLGGKN